MAAIPNTQYGRKCSLVLVAGEKALDLSAMRITFRTVNEDAESPANCSIRVYNLSEDTVKKIRGEYTRVVLQAGYESAAYGVIFDGTIRQYRIGREGNAVDSYLDILASDGDEAYNFAICNRTFAAGSNSQQRIAEAVKAMNPYGVTAGTTLLPATGGILPRGKVLFGLARAAIRAETQNIGCTWSIQNGQVQVLPLTGYAPGEAVVLNAQTGLIGRVEQTADGMRCQCLLNPKLAVGGLIKINNSSINQTASARGQELAAGQQPYNQYAGVQLLADVNGDGIYRVYVAEFVGDTRGNDWYTELVGLSVDPATNLVKAYG